MNLRRHFDNNSGFSIVEMLIVFTILAVAILPLAAIQFQSRQEVTEADRHSKAMQLAMSSIERARIAGFGGAASDTVAVDNFVAITTVSPDSSSIYLEEIQVVVTWLHGSNPRQLVLASKRSDR